MFVFLVIMQSVRVPRQDQQKALLIGIVFSVVARGGLIFLGSALIDLFAWVFYIFGLILLVTAGHLLVSHDKRTAEAEPMIVRMARAVVPTTDHHGCWSS